MGGGDGRSFEHSVSEIFRVSHLGTKKNVFLFDIIGKCCIKCEIKITANPIKLLETELFNA